MNKDQLLVIASDASVHAVSQILPNFPGLKMIRANSDTDAIGLMRTHHFAMVLLEDALLGIDALKIAAKLPVPGNSEAPPLLIITESSAPPAVFESLPLLQVDFLPKPLDPGMLKARLKIFLALYQNKIAVAKSIDELDHVYKKIMSLQKNFLGEQESRKKMARFSSSFASQIQSPLKNIAASLYQLQNARDLPARLGQGVNHIRNAADQISGITKRISALSSRTPERTTRLTDDTGQQRPCAILHVTGSKDEFDIFRHYLHNALNCVIEQAETIFRAKEIIAARELDIIFIDHLLADGTGLALLSYLTRLESDIPVIFTLDNSCLDMGAKAIAEGAYNFFIKEGISTQNILALIREALERSKLTKEINAARDRIVMISRRDHLTRLYNRQSFDQAMKTEMDKAGRYKIPLSILMVAFDNHKTMIKTHGYETCDQILSTSAALIKTMVRNLDVVCRYGDQEFGIMLPNTDLQGATILARRILSGIRDHGFDIDDTRVPLTVSIGIAALGKDTADQPQPLDQNLVKQALAALALTVQQGGNTLGTFSKSDHTP
ncbi:MAG: diguanylate cyclase [Proteobacteria bacterium]|nr:diguanylate cyclase [Desulfobacula sp.]MBU3950758.1 diguanylate cyclase [Pseudomonadota bacterium]MBU4132014.1 diguanylate cyclase [Pseudomonadota bacterium]